MLCLAVVLSAQDKFGSERRKAKTLNFSIAYGKTAMGCFQLLTDTTSNHIHPATHRLAADWNVSREEAQATLEKWQVLSSANCTNRDHAMLQVLGPS